MSLVGGGKSVTFEIRFKLPVSNYAILNLHVIQILKVIMNIIVKFIVFFGMCLSLSACWTTQSGQKSGIIVKVAKEGKYWGTFEGELIKGGLEDASGVTGKEFLFTLGQFNSELVKKAKMAMQRNAHVVLDYHCEEFIAPWRGETHCFADNIELVGGKK